MMEGHLFYSQSSDLNANLKQKTPPWLLTSRQVFENKNRPTGCHGLNKLCVKVARICLPHWVLAATLSRHIFGPRRNEISATTSSKLLRDYLWSISTSLSKNSPNTQILPKVLYFSCTICFSSNLSQIQVLVLEWTPGYRDQIGHVYIKSCMRKGIYDTAVFT